MLPATAATAPAVQAATASAAATRVVLPATAVAPPVPATAPTAPTVLDLFHESPVPVTAAPLPPRPTADRTAAASSVGRERLDQPAAELAGVLEAVPGVATVDAGSMGGVATASIRGASAEQTRVYLDGVPMNQGAGGIANLATLPVGNLEQVDVYRGAAPVGYGGAIGGVIDLTTRRPDRRRLELAALAGSFGTYGGRVLAAAPWGTTASVVGAAAYTRTDGDFTYTNDGGTAFDPSDDREVRRTNNDGEQLDALARGEVDAGPVDLSLAHAVYAFRGGLPGNGLRPATHARHDELRSVSVLTAAGRGRGAGDWRPTGRLFLAVHRSRQQDRRAEFGVAPNDTDNRTLAPGGRFTVAGAPADWLVLEQALGLTYERYRPRDDARSGPEQPSSRRWAGLAAVQPAVRPLGSDRLELVPTVDIQWLRTDVHGETLFGDPVAAGADSRVHLNYRFGAAWRPVTGVAVKANYAVAHREPSFLELFGDGAFVLPSPALRPERGESVDLGATVAHDWAGGRDVVTAELFGFHRYVEDLIQFQQATRDTFVATNFEAATFVGVEAAARLDLCSLLRLDGAATWLRTVQHSAAPSRDGKALPLRPELSLEGRAELHRRGLGPLHSGALFTEVAAQSANYVDPSNLVRVPPRVLVHLGVRAAVLDGDLGAEVSIRNVAGEQVQDLVGFPLPGRAVYATLRYRVM